MTCCIFYLHQHTVLIGQGGLVAIAVNHGCHLAILRVIEIVFLSRLFCEEELVVFIFLHLAEHASRSHIFLAILGVGVGSAVTRLYLHTVNGINAVAHLIA